MKDGRISEPYFRGKRIVPSAESLQDWRGDYERSAVMLHGASPSFGELMEFVADFEKEYKEWVSLI